MNSQKDIKEFSLEAILKKVAPYLIGFYTFALLILLLAELGVPFLEDNFRATNQVLLLIGLLVLPFIFSGMSKFVESLTIKFSGQELHVKMIKLGEDVHEEVRQAEVSASGQVSTAEQSLWPLLAGEDPKSNERLSRTKPKVIIGSKLDLSQIFFANLLGEAVSTIKDVECELRVPNGGSLRNFADVKNGWIDMYIDFTGTCIQYFSIDHRNRSDDEIIEELNFYGKSIGLTWLQPLGASEDYCLVMSKEKADDLNIKSMQGLISHGSNLVFNADPEFLNRKDCYLGLKKYGIQFKDVKACKVSERYNLLEAGMADVFVGYETDPQIGRGDVIRLEDPDQYFPKYMAIPLVSTRALKKIPELGDALSKLHNIMTTDDLIKAVRKISDSNGASPVAREQAISVLNGTH